MRNIKIIKNFERQDLENAKYNTEDKGYLLEFEEKVEHSEVFAI